MKTVRFSELVKRAGKPQTHLVLTKPAQDKTLQAAIKKQRVMTVFQNAAGSKADSAEVGFEEGSSRQYLIFPKSIHTFEGRKVVGIKYDLLSSEDVPKSKRAEPAKPSKKRAQKISKASPAKHEPSRSNVIEFPRSKSDQTKTDLRDVKRWARQAVQALEKGKQIVAFNLLKRIADV